MPNPQKERVVEEITEQLKQAKGIYLTDFTGLDVEQITQLRSNFRGAGVEYRVVKNSLTRLSANKAGMDNIVDYLTGPTALAFGIDDSVAPARIIAEFAKQHNKPQIKIGLVEGELVDSGSIDSIIKIPSREVLLSQVVGAFSAPISGFVGTLKSLLQSFVGTLDALREKKEQQAKQE